MARGQRLDPAQFASRVREILVEKGAAAAAKRFGKSETTIRKWAAGKSKPRDSKTIDTVNRSYTAQRSRWNETEHAEKLGKKYGELPRAAGPLAPIQHTGSILEYMKMLNNHHPLSRNAKAFFLDQHEKGNVMAWTGSAVMPVSDIRIIPAMSDPNAKSPTGALAFGLTAKYETGERGKRKQVVQGIVTQTINRGVYMTRGARLPPDRLTPSAMMAATKTIHLSTKVSKQKLPAIFLGYGDR